MPITAYTIGLHKACLPERSEGDRKQLWELVYASTVQADSIISSGDVLRIYKPLVEVRVTELEKDSVEVSLLENEIVQGLDKKDVELVASDYSFKDKKQYKWFGFGLVLITCCIVGFIVFRKLKK